MIEPGLYAVGSPDGDSNILVTANYKLTFDKLRRELGGINVWILVLDTKGINVWCAAGKGTFGTEELVSKIISSGISEIVNHKRVILPQLGAPGVKAGEVKKATGFNVLYGPVYAKDLKKYLSNDFKKSEKERTVEFKILDRIILIPVELNLALKYLALAFLILSGYSYFINKSFSYSTFIFPVSVFLIIISGIILFPVLLPFLPARRFALKGYILGIILSGITYFLFKLNLITLLILILSVAPVVSFFSLNFTGATTFTSLSGVKKEIKVSVPPTIISILIGITIKILTDFKLFF